MIKQGEISKKANEVGVRDTQIEKDYVLSWILNGIAQHDQLSKILVFKGGTVLKKVYFKDYRFSEDLDFTLVDDSVTNQQIFVWFKKSFENIKMESNIPLTIIDDNQHEDGGINFYIGYTGPLGGQGTHKKVKVDISRSEKLVFGPILQPVFLGYSDVREYKLLCYSLEEVLIEKLRSVMQRVQARDFYDIWYLTEIEGMKPEHHINEFNEKCRSKNLNPKEFSKKLNERLSQYKPQWEKVLKYQIKDLPSFDQVQRETVRHLKGL